MWRHTPGAKMWDTKLVMLEDPIPTYCWCCRHSIWSHTGVSARTFRDGLKEHLRAPYPIYYYTNTSCHLTKYNNFSTVSRESHTITMTIKEAMLIRVNDPFLNRNTVKYQLPYKWNVLSKTLISSSKRPSLSGQSGPLCKTNYTSPQGSILEPTLWLQYQN